MARFYFFISDGIQAEIALDVENAQAALNDGLNALAQYAFRNFPPPENISITISDHARAHVATLQLSFKIDYGKGIAVLQ
jgi:hypothetical protein